MITAASQTQHTELILRQIDSLPTLPAIATRLLSLTASEESHIQEVVDLISADPALTAKVLALCRTADRGVQSETLTVERAVVLLGFDAVRNAVLSVKVFEAFEEAAVERGAGPGDRGSGDGQWPIADGGWRTGDGGSRSGDKPGRSESASAGPGEQSTDTGRACEPETANKQQETPSATPEARHPDPESPDFERLAFWSHSIGVGVVAELLAEAAPGNNHGSGPANGRGSLGVSPSEAFVCGLLHDIGKLALHHVLPKSFAKVVALAELNQGNIAEYERRVMGLDHHTAGKRLAEQWDLPHPLQDCIWLHGATPRAVPTLGHRRLIGLVSLADLIARHQHLGYSGNHPLKPDPRALAEQWGFDPALIERVLPRIYDRFAQRRAALGLDQTPSPRLFVQSMQRANEALGRLNTVLERRSRAAADQGRVLEAISGFHSRASPAQTVEDVFDAVAASAGQALGPGFLALICPTSPISGGDEQWLISQYAEEGRALHSQYIEPPAEAPSLRQIDATQPAGLNLMGLLPWVSDYLLDAEDLRQVQLMPLACGWGTAGVLLHDRERLPAANQLAALASTWGAAVAAASQHEGARRLGEQLAESNSALAEAQDTLLRQQSLARLGEMAAGAAHEMNNPLAVIAGRSQLLTLALEAGGKQHQAARTIYQASHKLSDLISALRMFADPPRPVPETTALAPVVNQAVRKAEAQRSKNDAGFRIESSVSDAVPDLSIDATQIRKAIVELLLNAIQAAPERRISVHAQLEPGGEKALIRVSDDGEGMDEHTLHHATDPFFSNKAAGRRMGMGLPRAQQWIHGHGGSLELHATRGEGTTATFTLPLQSAHAATDTAS